MKMLSEEEVVAIFERCMALLTGHFVYTSGRHGQAYVDKRMVLPYTRELQQLCWMLANHFRLAGVQVVVAPAIGGIALNQWVAHFLTSFVGADSEQILAVTAEKKDGDLVFAGQLARLVEGKKVLAVDDITTTGGSVEKMNKLIRATGGEVVGVGLLWNRGGIEFDVPSYSLVTLQFDSWPPPECPLCKENVPFTETAGHAGKGK